MYQYELHTHTAEVSRCAASAAADTVALYREHGYDGLVITDHYSPMTFMQEFVCTAERNGFLFDGL